MISSKFEFIEHYETGFSEVCELLSPSHEASHPRYSTFGLEYYPLALGKDYRNCSFAVLDGNEPMAVAICGTNGDTFSQFGATIQFFISNGLNKKKEKQIFQGILKHIADKADGEKALKVADKIGQNLTQIGEISLSLDGKLCAQVFALVELTKNENEIYSAIRKSYRPFINWGRKNLQLEYINADNPSYDKFFNFQNFHYNISGRKTRSQESWDVMYTAIRKNMAELTLGYHMGELVSGTLIIDGKDISIYASGVYDRSKFNLPLSHWPLYDGILRSKKRGKKVFEIGLVDKGSNLEKKEMQIASFKCGFANNLSPEIHWLVPV